MKITRRDFLKYTGSIAITTAYPILLRFSPVEGKVYNNYFESPLVYAKIKIIKARQAGLYRDDKIVRKEFNIAASQFNPFIKRMYKTYFEHPISHRAHHLLHTHYVKRI